jgi:hypothetical protein
MKMARKLDVSSSEIEKVSVCDFEIKVKIIFILYYIIYIYIYIILISWNYQVLICHHQQLRSKVSKCGMANKPMNYFKHTLVRRALMISTSNLSTITKKIAILSDITVYSFPLTQMIKTTVDFLQHTSACCLQPH